MFIGYAQHNASYRFLVTKSDNNAIEVNTIVETKNAEFFEHIFLLKTHKEKPSHASSSSHAKNLVIMKRLNEGDVNGRKENDLGKISLYF